MRARIISCLAFAALVRSFAVAGDPLQPDVALETLARSLPDFSRAGYHGGDVEIPTLKPTLNVRDFGAKGDGVADDTAALQAAIAQAAKAGGGVIEMPAGRWVLTRQICITTSRVIIQGAGSDKTILVFPKSLSEMYLGAAASGQHRYSFSGGMFEINGGSSMKAPTAITTNPVKSGATEIAVAFDYAHPNGTGIKPGDWLVAAWVEIGGGGALSRYLHGPVADSKYVDKGGRAQVNEWIQVSAVKSNALVLTQPLTIEVRPEWSLKFSEKSHIAEVGVEGLAFEFPERKQPGYMREPGFNAIQMESVVNGWVRDVRIRNADNGILIGGPEGGTACGHVTLQDIVIDGSISMRYPICLYSSYCLIRNWRVETPAIITPPLLIASAGAHHNVYANGYLKHGGTFDAHRALPFRNLFTDIRIDMDLKPSSDWYMVLFWGNPGGRGPWSVFWNIDIRFPEDEISSDGKPVQLTKGMEDRPSCVFVGFHGNRPLEMRAVAGMNQRVVSLNEKPAIENLYEYQMKTRHQNGKLK